MASKSLYTNPLVDLYRTIGVQRGASPAFINASIAQGISESSLDPNARGDGGLAHGLHQWHPDRYNNLLALSQKMNLPPTDPRVQINFWYDENKKNLGIADPRAANDAAIGSERPAGWKPGDPTGVPSYNKRLGDTMALMRLTNGQSDPQDPRSFVATAPNAPQPTEGVPPQAQSINLGDEENTQPLNNLGSTLANMGASIASLDRGGTGIASLNASKVASNLALQEAAREREGGWKYAGQTQNGQGMIFQNSKGQIRVEPLSGGFSGQREPETIRTLKMLQADPSLMDTLKEKNADSGTQPQTAMLNDDGRRSVVEDYIAGNDAAFRNLNKADVAAAQNQLAEFKNKYGITSEDIMGNRGKWRGVFGAEREYSKRIANVSSAEASLSAAIGQGRELLTDPEVKSMLNNPRIFNKLSQFTVEQLNSEGLGKLAKLKENFETVAQDYTRVNAMGGSTTTVSAQDIARGILNTGMSTKAINDLFDYMGQTGLRVKGALEAGQEELRTNARKHTKIEDYQKSQAESERRIAERLDRDMVKFGLKPKSTITGDEQPAPAAESKTNAPKNLDPGLEAELRRRGLMK